MDVPEFAAKTGLDEQLLIRIESGIDEPQSDVLIAIAKVWPEYAVYLLTDEVDIEQKNPEVEKLAKKLGISGSKDGELIAQRAHNRWFKKHGTQ